MQSNISKLYKVLTRNDAGETGSHQSGITIPAVVANSKIFPDLGISELNPRAALIFFDEDKHPWEFQYIYYNDIYFGKPKEKSHNEHRLTCVKDYIRNNNIKSGDTVWFGIDDNGVRHIGFEKANEPKKEERNLIKLTGNWHYVKM